MEVICNRAELNGILIQGASRVLKLQDEGGAQVAKVQFRIQIQIFRSSFSDVWGIFGNMQIRAG